YLPRGPAGRPPVLDAHTRTERGPVQRRPGAGVVRPRAPGRVVPVPGHAGRAEPDPFGGRERRRPARAGLEADVSELGGVVKGEKLDYAKRKVARAAMRVYREKFRSLPVASLAERLVDHVRINGPSKRTDFMRRFPISAAVLDAAADHAVRHNLLAVDRRPG